jgi:hypothetical protein
MQPLIIANNEVEPSREIAVGQGLIQAQASANRELFKPSNKSPLPESPAPLWLVTVTVRAALFQLGNAVEVSMA